MLGELERQQILYRPLGVEGGDCFKVELCALGSYVVNGKVRDRVRLGLEEVSKLNVDGLRQLFDDNRNQWDQFWAGLTERYPKAIVGDQWEEAVSAFRVGGIRTKVEGPDGEVMIDVGDKSVVFDLESIDPGERREVVNAHHVYEGVDRLYSRMMRAAELGEVELDELVGESKAWQALLATERPVDVVVEEIGNFCRFWYHVIDRSSGRLWDLVNESLISYKADFPWGKESLFHYFGSVRDGWAWESDDQRRAKMIRGYELVRGLNLQEQSDETMWREMGLDEVEGLRRTRLLPRKCAELKGMRRYLEEKGGSMAVVRAFDEVGGGDVDIYIVPGQIAMVIYLLHLNGKVDAGLGDIWRVVEAMFEGMELDLVPYEEVVKRSLEVSNHE